MTMKACCRQKTFSLPTKILEIPPAISCFYWSYLYIKYLTYSFESLWACLTTSTSNNWLNLPPLLIPYHMQKTNFITQLILGIKMTHYLLLLWACCYVNSRYLIHLKQPTNISCFHRPLVISKNSTWYPNLFVRYCSLKDPAFWIVLRFMDHNSRTRFSLNMSFLQKVKRSLPLSYWSKKING